MPLIESLADVTRRARDKCDRAQKSALHARQSVKLAQNELRKILKRSKATLALKPYPY